MEVDFKNKSRDFVSDVQRSKWHDTALWFVRSKRDVAVMNVDNWEELRNQASNIKEHCISNLDKYLIEFEANAKKNGVYIHWAIDGDEHNEIVGKILKSHNIKKLVKSKSMLTEECELNPYLEKQGIEVIDTDLGERIIQMRNETPSHIVLPAIHIKKEEVSELFAEKWNTEKGNNDPEYLTYQARMSLRKDFLSADAALTGVNFAIAETGEVVVCTNEGNADLGVNITNLQIHSMGLEKVIPKRKHLGVFTRMLARSATGQAITVYTSHFKKPKLQGEMHVIIVDNGRSERLKKDYFWTSLKCIRCGACMNTCPIYRRSGGHSYGYTIPGPIGAILTPNIDLKKYSDLPFASTLCGSCSDVCPVKIDIHNQLYKWRQEIGKNNVLPKTKSVAMGIAGKILEKPKLFKFVFKIGRITLKILPDFIIYNKWNNWGKARTMPEIKKRKNDKQRKNIGKY